MRNCIFLWIWVHLFYKNTFTEAFVSICGKVDKNAFPLHLKVKIMENSIQVEANLLSRFERIPLNDKLLNISAMRTSVWVMESFDLRIAGESFLVLKKFGHKMQTILAYQEILSLLSVLGTMRRISYRPLRTKKVLLCTVFSFFTLIGFAYASVA